MAKNSINKKLKDAERKLKQHQKDVKRRDKFQISNPISKRVIQTKINVEIEVLKIYKDQLFKSLNDLGLLELGLISNLTHMPNVFSLEENYTETLNCIKGIATSLVNFMGHQITIDFNNCKKCDSSALFMLQVVHLELLEKMNTNKFAILDIKPKLMIGLPKVKTVERLLIVHGFLGREHINESSPELSELYAIDFTGYLKGSKPQKSHNENKKGPHTKKIVNYLDDCLRKHGYKFTAIEWNEFEGIISEVLSNAEDHTNAASWYVSANFSQEIKQKNKDILVGEINLTIMNFGHSMFEAFVLTKEENILVYSRVEEFANAHIKKYGPIFDNEQLFTFVMIQDQISRLKYEEESRGTGTMKFINSFLDLGDFEDPSKGYVPNLSIYSGHSLIMCDNTSKPIKSSAGVFSLALNSKNDLTLPPEKKFLKSLKKKFPGTLISVKIYLNKEHLDAKYCEGGKRHD
jgi:hypothetical protein